MILTNESVQARTGVPMNVGPDLRYPDVVGIHWTNSCGTRYVLEYEDGTLRNITEEMLIHMTSSQFTEFYNFLQLRLGDIPVTMPVEETEYSMSWEDEYGMNRIDHSKPSRSEEIEDAIRVALSSHGPRIIYVADSNWQRLALDMLHEYSDDQGWAPSEDDNYLPLDKTKVIIGVDPAVEDEYRKLKVVIPSG